ncbi:hypothetical protein K8R30_02910 [archaeon]|nr:hypothetical protein [archaeon]
MRMNWRFGNFEVLLVLLILVGGSFSGAEFEDGSLEQVEDGEGVVGVVEGVLEIVEVENKSVEDEVNVSDVVEDDVEVNLTEENDSVLGNVSNASFVYVDIEDLIENKTEEKEDGVEEKEIEKEKISRSLVEDGQIEIEFEAFEDEVVEIEKKELLRGEFEKVVLISSDEHFDDELRVYSDLPVPALEENIVVTWENEGEVVEDVECYDGDGDGLVERISWIVPHLSTQEYRIEIVWGGEENASYSDILLNVISPENDSMISNPVNFNISVDYSNLSNVDCILSFDGGVGNLLIVNQNENASEELSSGSHTWIIECWDHQNITIRNLTSGNFEVFDFSIDGVNSFYFNHSSVFGNVRYQDSFGLVLNDNVVSSSDGSFEFSGSDISVPGSYVLNATTDDYEDLVSVVEDFVVGAGNVKFEDVSVELGDDVVIKLDIDSQGLSGDYRVYVDGGEIRNGLIGASGVSASIGDFVPSAVGSYSLSVVGQIDGNSYNFVGSNVLVVSEVGQGGDDSSPEVDLNFPAWDDVINNSMIEFWYDVEDDVNVANCSFELYNATKGSGGIYETDELIFPLSSSDKDLAFEGVLDKKDNVRVKLIDFDEGDYVWEVRCYDSSGNSGWDFNYFSVDLNETNIVRSSSADGYDREAEVSDLIDKVNEFLEKKDDFGLDERRILEIFGFWDDMSFYKKQLVQMDQDLKFNLKFMEQAKRDVRVAEIYSEIDEIKGSVVLDVDILDSYEFSKSSVDVDVGDVLGDYFEAEDVSLKSGAFRGLVKFNEELQNDLGVKVEAWKLKINGFDKDRVLVLINKELDVDGGFDGKILEVIPDDMKDAVFVSDAKDVGAGIWEIGGEDDVIYYFEEDFELEKIEKVESLLFSDEEAEDNFMITGFFVNVGEVVLDGSSFFVLVGFLFMGYFGFLVFGKVRIESWKKEPSVVKILDLLGKAKILLKEKDVEGARGVYLKMNDAYRLLPGKCREFFYKEIGRVRLAIDKRDVLNLVKEYEKAKDGFRKEDAVALHGRINEIYRKLPKKFQERVYRRLVKKEI